MKANELQIGDYVNYRGQIIKVTSLYDKGGSNEVGWSDKESVWVNGRCIEPIPLTPDILKDNGFIITFEGELHKIYFQDIDGFAVEIKIDCIDYTKLSMLNGLGYKVVIECKHVHQLQHALRLCGIEKEIEL